MEQPMICFYFRVQDRVFSFVPKKCVYLSFMAPLTSALYYILDIFPLFSPLNCKLPKYWDKVLLPLEISSKAHILTDTQLIFTKE